MASKYSFELSLDTKGYTDGAKKAEDANADFASSIGNVRKNLPNLRKELAAAKKETAGLAYAYAQLTAEQKNSGFGKALAKQLDEAKQNTAELIDLNGDLANELKVLASDTLAWDAMKEGIGIVKDSLTAAIATFGEMTNTADDLAPVLKNIAQVQSIASTAISVGNALQKQSAIMCGVRKIQEIALAKAIEAETTATNGATVAQRIFNTVAKANPYVLLASAILAVGAAIVTFTLATNKAEDATSKLNKEMHATSVQAQKDAQADITKLDILYKRTQDTKLSIDERRKAAEKLQELYPAYFSNMSTEQIMLGESSRLYQQLKNDIIAVAMAKAYEQKIADIAKEKVDLEDQLEAQQQITKELDKQAKAANNAAQNRPKTSGGAVPSGDLQGQIAINNAVVQSREEEKKLTKQINEKTAAQGKYLDKINETIPAQERLTKNEELVKDNNKNKGGGKGGKATTVEKEVEAATGSITELEAEISDLRKKLKDGLIPDKEIDSTLNRIKNLQSQVKTLNIKYGFEEPEKAKTKLEKLQEDLAKQTKAYEIAVDTNDEKAKQAALDAIYKTQDEIDKHKVLLTIEPRTTEEERANIKREISNIVNTALKPDEQTLDFSALKENMSKGMAAAVDKTLNEYNRIKNAREELNKKLETATDDATISAILDGLSELDEAWNKVIEDVNLYKQANDELVEIQESTESLADTVGKVGNAVNAAADLFSALGDASDDNSTKAMGIVAQAIATIALSFAKALTTAKTWVDWLAFGVSGLATMATMISQVKNLTAGSYATGGIIGGSSYRGDRMIANVNSGEMILNRRQQKNLFDAIDQNKLDNAGTQKVYVTGEIAGTKMLIVQKNTIKELNKTGKNITF